MLFIFSYERSQMYYLDAGAIEGHMSCHVRTNTQSPGTNLRMDLVLLSFNKI